MSVIVKGMEMPTSCGECKAFVCYSFYGYCGITKNNAGLEARNADCPLVSVPPHGRLIDADALKSKAEIGADECGRKCLLIKLGYVNTMPTIIEAEIEKGDTEC